MAFTILQENIKGWVAIVNANFAQAYSYNSPTVMPNYSPRIASVQYPDLTADTLAVVSDTGAIVPSQYKYSDMLVATSPLTPAASTSQDMVQGAKIGSNLQNGRGGNTTQVRTVSFKATVPADNTPYYFRFSLDYLALVKLDSDIQANTATLMVTNNPVSAATIIEAGANVVVVPTVGKLQVSPTDNAVVVNNDTGLVANITLTITYSTGSDAGIPPLFNRGTFTLLYDYTNMVDFTTRQNMNIVNDVLLSDNTGSPHTAETLPVIPPVFGQIAKILDIETESVNPTNISTSSTADLLQATLEFADGDLLVFVSNDGLSFQEVTATGVTLVGGTVYTMDTATVTLGTVPAIVYKANIPELSFDFTGAFITPTPAEATYLLPLTVNQWVSSVYKIYLEEGDTNCGNRGTGDATYVTSFINVATFRVVVINCSTANRGRWQYKIGGSCYWGGNAGNAPHVNRIVILPAGADVFRMYYAYKIGNPAFSLQGFTSLEAARKYVDITGSVGTPAQITTKVEVQDAAIEINRIHATLWEF